MSNRHKIIERAERMTAEESKAMQVNEHGSPMWYMTSYSTDIHNRPDLGSSEQTVFYYRDGTSVEVRVGKKSTIPPSPPLGDLPEGLVWNVTNKGEFVIAHRNESLGEPPE